MSWRASLDAPRFAERFHQHVTQAQKVIENRLIFLGFAVLMTPAPQVRTAGLEVDHLLARQHSIRAGMQAGTGLYQSLPASVRSSLQANQGKLARLLEGKVTLSQLAPANHDEVLELTSRIEAAISDAPQQRLSCTREARTGSNVMTRSCRTRRRSAPRIKRLNCCCAMKVRGSSATRGVDASRFRHEWSLISRPPTTRTPTRARTRLA